MKKVTQKQAAFYTLYSAFKAEPERYIPTFEFVGEMEIPELGVWVLRSYKCPTRLTDIFQENPRLLERRLITGKSGAKYYGYRFAAGVTSACIDDPTLQDFYKLIKAKQ